MTASRALFGLLLAAATLLPAATAAADPVVAGVDAKVSRNRRLRLALDVAFTEPGVVIVEGTVNGVPVRATKRLRRSGARRVRFAFAPKRRTLRGGPKPIEFDLEVMAEERGGARSTPQPIDVEIPVPLLVLPGLGNEGGTNGVGILVELLDADGRYQRDSRRPLLEVHGYESLAKSLPQLGRELDRAARRLLRGTPFRRVDVVGYSMGGLVARSWIAWAGGARRAHNCVLLGTPNEGTPLAYLAAGLGDSPLLPVLLGDDSLVGVADAVTGALVDDDTTEALRNLYPTYPWAVTTIPIIGGTAPVPPLVYELLLGDSSTPLTALNEIAPAADVRFHAFGYSTVGSEQLGLELGTIDTVDFGLITPLLTGNATEIPDLAMLLDGEGDGVVPLRSALFTDVAAWRDAVNFIAEDLGAGTHLTLPSDPAVATRIAQALRSGPAPAPAQAR